jgi:uncharacterized membrane protein required for colicin V production
LLLRHGLLRHWLGMSSILLGGVTATHLLVHVAASRVVVPDLATTTAAGVLLLVGASLLLLLLALSSRIPLSLRERLLLILVILT